MIQIPDFTNKFLDRLKAVFAERIWFVGLQGSYARGEATEKSDIDIVVIFDELSSADIQKYNSMLDALPHRELICGFISGKHEILNWDPGELFQFYYDTKPLYGSLDELLPLIDSNALERAVKVGACTIYHGCVHNMLHEKSLDVLKGLYKSASFVMQAIVFKRAGKYVTHKSEMIEFLSEDERCIIDNFLRLKSNVAVDFNKVSDQLFLWVKGLF